MKRFLNATHIDRIYEILKYIFLDSLFILAYVSFHNLSIRIKLLRQFFGDKLIYLIGQSVLHFHLTWHFTLKDSFATGYTCISFIRQFICARIVQFSIDRLENTYTIIYCSACQGGVSWIACLVCFYWNVAGNAVAMNSNELSCNKFHSVYVRLLV